MRMFVLALFAAFSVIVFSAVGFVASLTPEETEFHDPHNHLGFASREGKNGKEILLRIKSPPPGSDWFLLVEQSDSPILSVSRGCLRYKGEIHVAEARQDRTTTIRKAHAWERTKPVSWCNLDEQGPNTKPLP